MSSIFKRILDKELPSFAIRENEEFYAFLDIHPVMPGHTLVIPKVEVDEFFDMEEALLSGILGFSRPIASALKQVLGVPRVGLAVAGFDVPHAHLHLIPLNQMSDFDFTKARAVSPEQLEGMADKIRRAMR